MTITWNYADGSSEPRWKWMTCPVCKLSWPVDLFEAGSKAIKCGTDLVELVPTGGKGTK